MKLLIKKVCQGVLNTGAERVRIARAFKNSPETQKRLLKLMDAIEAQDWKKAGLLLADKWWRGRDKKSECPRQEFLGMLNLADPKRPKSPAVGFDHWARYGNLIYVMASKQKGGAEYTVTPIEEKK